MHMSVPVPQTQSRLSPALLVLLCLILLLPAAAQAQRQQRFKAGVLVGVTAAQIDGVSKLIAEAGMRWRHFDRHID